MQVRQFAIVRFQNTQVRQLELLAGVGQPVLGKALPDKRIDAARAQQMPERNLYRAGVGGRDDTDAVVGRDVENGAGPVDHRRQFGLAGTGPVGAAQ